MSKEKAYQCMQCGSPAIERSPLVGGTAKCLGCGWTGKNEDLHSVDFETGFASPEAVVQRFASEISGIVAKGLAKDIGGLLLKWGFVEEKMLKVELPIYVKAVAVATVQAVISTRQGLATGAVKAEIKVPR